MIWVERHFRVPHDEVIAVDGKTAQGSHDNFHWTMDVVFGEDASRVCLDEAPENFAVIRHIAMNLLKRYPSTRSLKRKRFRAALDDNFLLELLSSI